MCTRKTASNRSRYPNDGKIFKHSSYRITISSHLLLIALSSPIIYFLTFSYVFPHIFSDLEIILSTFDFTSPCLLLRPRVTARNMYPPKLLVMPNGHRSHTLARNLPHTEIQYRNYSYKSAVIQIPHDAEYEPISRTGTNYFLRLGLNRRLLS